MILRRNNNNDDMTEPSPKRKTALDVFRETQRIRKAALHGDRFMEENLSPRRHNSRRELLDFDDEIEEEEKTPNLDMSDRFEIEDLPPDEEDANIHDQLPSVEDAKANLNSENGTSTNGYKNKILAALALIVIVVGVTSMAKGNKKKSAVTPSSRGEEIIDLLFDLHVSPLPALKDSTFAQHRAAMFVADGDAYEMDPHESPEAAQKFVERYVLSTLYYHFNGGQWNNDLHFLSAQDHCNWWRTFETVSKSSDRTIRIGVECNEAGFVTKLNLARNNLNGRGIPDEIKSLIHLETLHFYFNPTSGIELSPAFRGMSQLKSIGLMRSGLIGTIPDWIGEMTQLTALALGNNQLVGRVPQSISNLHNLEILGLDDNLGLTGNLGLFKQMNSLRALYLEGNAFTGQLPPRSSTWPNLVELDLSNNFIDESIPSSIINHKKLVVLDLHKNMLGGTFPDDIFMNANLQVLALHENVISGTIPDRLPFLQNLQHVDFSFNLLTGTIPDNVSQLKELRYWSTTNNRFSEQRMPNFSEMSNLMDISMKSNNLIGTVPDWLGGLFNLQMLDLDSNALTGSIPTWLGLLVELNHLLLNRNQLTGTIPSQLANLQQLDVLLLDGNSIEGHADVICEAQEQFGSTINPTLFTADCYPGQNGEHPEIECRCCTTCCIDSDTSCNNHKWTSHVDPVWEYGFLRPNYVFSLDNAPGAYSKEGDAAPSDPIDDAFAVTTPRSDGDEGDQK